MTVEERRSGSNGEDRFPIGMRVLAVDDDPTCLLILETLLKRCQYQVTTTNQAITALKMLRENRNKYDLVISDVNMPDMDGFKLLELVGLEMDLPVIMLSAHSDTKLVMKGVTHGACDYLLKPVRIEELQNIWQHVVRRKKLEPKDTNKEPNQDGQPGVGEAGSVATSAGSGDQNGKAMNKKRKDQYEEEEEGEDDEHENEDPSTQKKPRVVWSVELHRNFVAAVNQLGFDKAVPKKILELMNVEGITRENVASHLQKYRLYLKKQASMIAAQGNRDILYLRTGSMDGYGDFRTFNGPGRFSSTFSSSYQPGGVLGRLNSSPALSHLRAISPSANTTKAASNAMHTLGKIQPTGVPASQNQSINLLQNIPTPLEDNQQSQNKSGTRVTEFTNNVNGSIVFGVAGSSPNSRVMSSSAPAASSSSFLLPANTQAAQSSIAYGNQSSLELVSLPQESFDIGVHGSSNFLDHSRCDENWKEAGISKFPANSARVNEAISLEDIPSNNFHDNISWSGSVALSSSMGHTAHLEDGRRNMQYQAGLSSNLLHGMKQWQDQKHNYFQNINNSFSSRSLASECDIVDQSNAFGNDKANALLLGHINGDSPLVVQQTQGEKSVFDPKLSSNFSFGLEQQKHHNGFIQSNYSSMDEIMSTIVKPGQMNETALIDGEFGFDAYSLGSCM